jgi:hypothetical protein
MGDALLVHVMVRGLTWPVLYWLIVAVLGFGLQADNLRAALGMSRSIRHGEAEERPMRTASAGLLAVNTLVAAALLLVVFAGAGLLFGSFNGGLSLQFSGPLAGAAVIGFALSLATAPTLTAALLWRWRRRTLHAVRWDRRRQPRKGPTLPAMTTVIAVTNHSTVVSDAEVQAALPDFQTQLNRDFEPAWGRGASLAGLVAKNQQPAPGCWQIVLLDDADQAGALGYHDVTPDGRPLSKVFVKTTKDAGESWTVVFTHELLEMLADPYINSVTFIESGSGGFLIPVEVGDPVEGEQYGYTVGKTLCTDFVLPSWFRQGTAGPWDHAGHLEQPLYVLPGGYVSIAEATLPNGWQQVFGDLAKGGTPRPGGPVIDSD